MYVREYFIDAVDVTSKGVSKDSSIVWIWSAEKAWTPTTRLRTFTHLENRFNILPLGVVSKKLIGDRKIYRSVSSHPDTAGTIESQRLTYRIRHSLVEFS